MSIPFIDWTMATALWVMLKVSLVVAGAAIACTLQPRRRSAASRHMVWTLGIAGLLLLPIVSAVVPSWDASYVVTSPAGHLLPLNGQAPAAAVAPAPAADSQGGSRVVATMIASPPDAPAARGTAWASVLPVLYAVGTMVLLIRLGSEHLALRRLVRRATDVGNGEWTRLLLECAGRVGVRRPVRLLRSHERTMPMAVGVWRAAILIPSIADTWSEDRRRAVLLHELAHVARYDCLTQMMAAVACAIYWVHPGVWWIARRLRVERELACDDRVLAAGACARDYAGHLLEIAYALGGTRAPALAVSMARPRQLEGRMLAVLDGARNRATPAFHSRLAGVAIMAALVVPLASADARIAASPVDIETPRGASGVAEPAQRPGRASSFPQEASPGTWEIRPKPEGGMVQLRFSEEDGTHQTTMSIDRLEGLSAAQMAGAGGQVRFTIRRDAGTFTFEGTFRAGVGAGTFTFAPSATFPVEFEKRGFDRPAPADQYLFARSDIGLAYLDELTSQRYQRPDLPQLIRAAMHGVGLDYLREMGKLGYRLERLEALIRQRDHGVSPQFIRDLAAQGLPRLSPDDLVRARDHGVSPDYVRELRDLGHSALSLDALVAARDHGISLSTIRELRDLGHRLTLPELTRARDHGVSPEYIRGLAALGNERLSLEALIGARGHGVSPEYARDLRALGYQDLSLDNLIRLRDHGVSPEYVRDLKALGYDRLAIDELVSLRDHGVSPERVRAANTRAGKRLSVDMLKEFAANGWR